MKPSSSSTHLVYIAGSLVAAIMATMGVSAEVPVLYGILPGLIGAVLAVFAALRFLRQKKDLAGFVATGCGFIFYQAFQANPVTLPDFTRAIEVIDPIDRMVGIFFGNFTTGMLLLAVMLVRPLWGRLLKTFVPSGEAFVRKRFDHYVFLGFLVVFAAVALPNVLFGKVVVGALMNIMYQRAAWAMPGEFTGFAVWGGALGASLMNTVLWSTSLVFIWVYLLRSRFRLLMLILAPLVLIWTASVAFQGSRTYLVTIAFGMMVYVLGRPGLGSRLLLYAGIGIPVVFLLVQIASFYRTEGLRAINLGQVGERLLEIRGNEGATSQMDGLEFFRRELLAKDAAPNPVSGLVRGLVERPIEGLLMPVPRRIFPWKPEDEMATEYNLWYQRVRLGSNATEVFLGASPGLMGRELIRYGIFGPFTVLFWLGTVLALADRLYAASAESDFNRIFAGVLVAFLMAQLRDWVPMWVLPFMPAMLIFGLVGRKMYRYGRNLRRQEKRRAAREAAIADPSPLLVGNPE